MAAPAANASLDAWLAYIGSEHPKDVVLGLERVGEVARRLRLEMRCPVITVGGTNGKGSTCAYLEQILHVAGYRVGKYTSPHLLRYNERVRIAQCEATDAELIAAFAAVEAARAATPMVALTYFEFGTLAALWHFQRAALDALVLEVGLGGRLDAVNIVDADVAVVVSVDLDHMALLGQDRESIAFEKAGIYRPGKPALFGDRDAPSRLRAQALAIGADWQALGEAFDHVAHGPISWTYRGLRGKRHGLPMPSLRGRYQLNNASTALAALDALQDRLPVALGEVKRGLLEVALPGRFQVLPGQPVVVLDVAHNPHATRALADTLGGMGFYETTIGIFGSMQDKDIDGVIAAIAVHIDRWHVVDLPSERAATSVALAEMVSARCPGKPVQAHVGVREALLQALSQANRNDRILCFGSFLTAAEALAVLAPQ